MGWLYWIVGWLAGKPQVKSVKACDVCSTSLRFFRNTAGGWTYWCDRCDGFNSEIGRWLQSSMPPWPAGKPRR